MDALPIIEADDLPHRPQNTGVIHACRNDGHTDMLLGSGAPSGRKAKLFSGHFFHMVSARLICFVPMDRGAAGRRARSLHSSDYEFSDGALVAGSSYWVTLVEQEPGR